MGQDPGDATSERILDAAMATMLKFGIRRTSVEAIARTAKISHMTIYRRWSHKQDLVTAVLMREAQRLYAHVDKQVANLDTVEEKMVAGFTAIFWFFHTHPLIVRELDTDPEPVLTAMTAGSDPVIETSIAYLAAHIRSANNPTVTDDPEGLAELLVRVTHSLVLAPSQRHPFATEADAAQYARHYLLPMVRGYHTRVS